MVPGGPLCKGNPLSCPARLRRFPLLDTILPVTQTRTSSSQTWKRGQNTKIDFPALEAKWQTKWDNQDARTPQGVSFRHNPSSLSPFYLPHLHKPTTILETLEWHYGRTGAHFTDKKRSVFDSVLNFSLSKSTELNGHLRSFGADIVRTSLVFRDPIFEGDRIYKTELEQTQRWLESVWKAILSAHESYETTQRFPDSPNVPEALHEPGLSSWIDYISEEHLRWVQVPPEEPEMPNSAADHDERNLWLAAQKAILAYTRPITRRNSLSAIRRRLVRLTKAVADYGKAYSVCCSMHYYSARVLLSLLAPSAPAFAEECWVHLHYGCEKDIRDGSESRYGLDEDAIQEMIKETEDLLDRHHLPRQGQPSTLQSIFDQPFPIIKRGLLSQTKDSSGQPR